MRCVFTFICNGEQATTNEITVNVNTMEANVMNSIESALRGQHQKIKPGSYLQITSITCEGLTAENGDNNLYNKPLMKFKDSDNVYYFTVIGNYDFEPPADYKAMAAQERGFFNFFAGRRKTRKSRKNRKSRKSRR